MQIESKQIERLDPNQSQYKIFRFPLVICQSPSTIYLRASVKKTVPPTSMLKTNRSSEVSNPIILRVNNDEVVGSNGGRSIKKSG